MPFTAQELTDDLLRRVRDPSGTMHSRTFVRTVLSQVQRMVNARHRNVLITNALTTNATQQIYSILALLPSAIFVDSVRDGDREIPFVRWRELAHADPRWFRRTGSRIESYSLVGQDMLILHPGLPVAGSVTVLSTKLTADLTGESSLTEVTDDLIPEVMRLAEAVLLTRGRFLEQLVTTLQPERAGAQS